MRCNISRRSRISLFGYRKRGKKSIPFFPSCPRYFNLFDVTLSKWKYGKYGLDIGWFKDYYSSRATLKLFSRVISHFESKKRLFSRTIDSREKHFWGRLDAIKQNSRELSDNRLEDKNLPISIWNKILPIKNNERLSRFSKHLKSISYTKYRLWKICLHPPCHSSSANRWLIVMQFAPRSKNYTSIFFNSPFIWTKIYRTGIDLPISLTDPYANNPSICSILSARLLSIHPRNRLVSLSILCPSYNASSSKETER